MKNFYSEIDEITLTFSDIHTTPYGMEYIRIYFERPTESGFDFLESTIPSLLVTAREGFSDAEVQALLRYAQANAFLMWDIARRNADDFVTADDLRAHRLAMQEYENGDTVSHEDINWGNL